MNQNRPWLVASGVFVFFAMLASWAGRLTGATGRDLWILRIGLALLGAAAAVLAGMFLAARARREPAPAEREADDVGEALAAAQQRLAGSALAGGSRISGLPVVLVLGPAGSAKTSAVVHSGVEPELLAGEVERAGAVAPTRTLNVWYGRETVFLEAGGAMLDDEPRWARLVRHLQPTRMAAALGRGTQAPRVAVVCFPCDAFHQPGAVDAVPAAARRMRARLAELAGALGVRLPVYVLFTRADRLPYFAEYVRGLSRDEAQAVLGATFPAADPPGAGLYAEFAARRAGDALRSLARSLSVAQLDLLPREPREPARAGAYEFPRELRKVSDLATQFLVELCRPSQLNVSPFLRGFYFTGVRTVVAEDGPAPSATAASVGGQVALGATSVFDPRRLREMASAPAPARGAAREVPEWAFARRIFNDVILRDRVAMAATGGGTRVNALRRGLAAAALAACVIFAGGFTVSYRNNRVMLSGALAAAREARDAPADPASLAQAEALRRLDALRAGAATMAAYEREGAPLRMRWGLYAGHRAFPSLRRVYFESFDRQLWARTRPRLVQTLRALPEAPTDASQYGATYDDLKAYLVTTTHPRYGSAAFLGPVLDRHWADRGEADPERRALARRQFEFFGAELPHGNPFAPAPDEALIVESRAFLGRFAQAERFYRAMLDEAGRHARAVDFGALYPAAAPVAAAPHVVPGAFTREGWAYVRGNARAVERLFAREDWVLGPQAVGAEDRVRIGRELQARYVADYVAHWRTFLEAARVHPFGGLSDAAARLGPLSGNDSPVLQILSLASRHTSMDSVRLGPAFQPVHQVAPAAADRVAAEGTAAYVVALGGLRSALQLAAATPPELRGPPLSQAAQAAGQADGEVRKLAQGFRIDGEAAAVGAAVQRLLRTPIDGAQRVVTGAVGALPQPGDQAAAAAAAAADAAAAPVAAAARDFCSALNRLRAGFPFRGGGRDAAVDDLAGVFQPGASALAELQQAVQPLVSRQGPRYVARTGASPRPGSGFLGSLGRAAELSRALYGDDGSAPRADFTLRAHTSAAVPEVTVVLDGKTRRFTRTLAASESFTWRASDAGGARLVAQVNGEDVVLAEASGPWAAFRLFRGASWQDAGDGRYVVRWPLPGQPSPLSADVVFAGGVPVFNPDYLARVTCVPRIGQ
ncbi:MAG TPA: ImcF-related family protein [Longimicrobium sp.]|jgi:type VI secretion system protein ImpL